MKKPAAKKNNSAGTTSGSVELNAAKILASVSDAFLFLNADWQCTYVNEQAARMLDRAPEMLLGKNIWAVFPEAVGHPFHTAYYKAFETQEAVFAEEYYKPFDRWFEQRIYPSPEGLSIFIHDITARKRAELGLQESERRFREVLENVDLLAILLDTNGCVTFCNQYLLWLTGYSREEVMGQDWFSLFVPASRTDVKEMFFEGLRTGNIAAQYENPVRTKSGELRLVQFSNTLLRNTEGAAIGATSIGVDITDRKRVEAELLRKNRALATLSECKRAMVRSQNVSEMLDQVCAVIVNVGGYRMAWIGFNDHGTSKAVRMAAQSGMEDGYFEKMRSTWGDKKFEAGPTHRAIRSRDIIITRDFASEPGHEIWQEAAAKLGFAASIAIPFALPDDEVGALSIYSDRQNAFDAEELELLEELTRELSFAVASLHAKAERDWSEKALRESEERYQRISTVASDYMYSSRLNARNELVLDWVAGAFESITGYTLQEYTACGGWRARLHPEDVAQDDRDLVLLRSNRPITTELRTLTKSGETIWVQVSAYPVWNNEQNELTGIYGAVKDITARKQGEVVLRNNEQRLQTIYNTVGDIIFHLIVEGGDQFRFASVNPAFSRVTGLPDQVVVGKRISEIIPESSLPLVVEQYKKAIAQKSIVRWEETSDYPTGRLHGEVSVAPVFDEQGACTHLVGTVHDVTQRKHAEEEVRQLNAELEQRVQERTALLDFANKNLESFSYSVSHDLRAPLRAISGFASILTRRHSGALNDEGKHYLDNIVQASNRMGVLIDDLLTYSRVGRSGIRNEPVDLNAIVAEVLKDMEERIRSSHAIIDFKANLPGIRGDKTLVRQIFINLVDNALTYRKPDNVPAIAIRHRIENELVVVSVADNGIGIPAEHHEKIFNVFQRLHSDEQYPGTGIGLATVRKSAELLGGVVWVHSTVGEGSIFFVQLPGK